MIIQYVERFQRLKSAKEIIQIVYKTVTMMIMKLKEIAEIVIKHEMKILTIFKNETMRKDNFLIQ